MKPAPWFDQAFGPWYERIYPHRSLEEAERIWNSMDSLLPPQGALLDVGCGNGRHMMVLSGRGREVVGLDRSSALLSQARRKTSLPLVRGDMRRLPFPGECFGGLLSMFTSFGYFSSLKAHQDLLTEWSRVVRPGGRVIIDYLNAAKVAGGLVPESRGTVEGHTVLERRALETGGDLSFVVKEVRILRDGNPVAEYDERVALFAPHEIVAMAENAGLALHALHGDYDRSSYTEESPRSIFVLDRA